MPPHCPRELSEAIMDVISNSDLAKHMAENGREMVRELLDIERTGSRILSIYKQLLGDNAKESHKIGAVL